MQAYGLNASNGWLSTTLTAVNFVYGVSDCKKQQKWNTRHLFVQTDTQNCAPAPYSSNANCVKWKNTLPERISPPCSLPTWKTNKTRNHHSSRWTQSNNRVWPTSRISNRYFPPNLFSWKWNSLIEAVCFPLIKSLPTCVGIIFFSPVLCFNAPAY